VRALPELSAILEAMRDFVGSTYGSAVAQKGLITVSHISTRWLGDAARGRKATVIPAADGALVVKRSESKDASRIRKAEWQA
jgi:hypothetical protein